MSLFLSILFSIAFIIYGTAKLKQHPFLLLLLAAFGVGVASGQPFPLVLEYISKGFGDLLGRIGIVVILGCMIGVVLETSGAAQAMANAVLALFKSKRSTLAMSTIGAIIGIPVFCDSAYVILSKLSQQVAKQAKIPGTSTALGLAGGLYVSHCLIPPTPGPIAAAGNLGAESHMGTIILLGILVLIPNIFLVTWWSKRCGQKTSTLQTSESEIEENLSLPPLTLSLLPILIPLFLITLSSALKMGMGDQTTNPEHAWIGVLQQLGHPLIALFLGFILCLPLKKPSSNTQLGKWMTEVTQKGIVLAGPILILTGAGGAFGNVLANTSLTEVITTWLGKEALNGVSLLTLAFFLSMFLKTAQGSSTSTMVIVSSLLSPLAIQAGFSSGLELSLLVLSIGSGAMAASHANDSYFWVVSQFSQIPAKEAFRFFTIQTILQSLLAFAVILVIYVLTH